MRKRILSFMCVLSITASTFSGMPVITKASTSTTTDSVSSEPIYQFDFCLKESNPLMEGWTAVTATQTYEEEAGYGWITAPGNGRYRANNGYADSNDMTDDFCLGAGEFAVDLPNGTYEIKITAAELLQGAGKISVSYKAEGVSIGSISKKQAAGTLTTTVTVEDGQLNLEVGGTNKYINGLEITPLYIAPANLVSENETINGSVASYTLDWDAVENAASYNVYMKSTSDAAYSVVQNVTASAYERADGFSYSQIIGEDYSYYVTAVYSDGGESIASNIVEMNYIEEDKNAPSTPENLAYGDVEDYSVELTWDESNEAVKYLIYRSEYPEDNKAFKAYSKIGESTTASYTDTGVTVSQNWYYKVVAIGAGGASEQSEALETPINKTLVQKPAETLTDRALVAIDLAGEEGVGVGSKVTSGDSGVYLSWRLFEEDPEDVSFTIYKNNSVLVSGLAVTNYLDSEGSANDVYQVVGSSDDDLDLTSSGMNAWSEQYLEYTLDVPEAQTMPDGTTCSYTANDMSVGDLDGDGVYELIVKWSPSNAKDNSSNGYTGTTIIDAYDLDYTTGEATKMWRVDLGVNIRSGAHYTQFQVWDFDGDGKAELVCKTADGTMDGVGTVIGDADADYRNTSGRILEGPEYLTAFSGVDGSIIDTVDYVPARGTVSDWGDSYGNRVDRFLSAVAYLDGENASVVMCRGYYTRMVAAAWNLVDGKLVLQWKFDTTDEESKEAYGQGFHSLSVNDVDSDGKDEIVYGSCAIDDDGTLMYSTGLGHGDAMHVSDWIPEHEGLEVFAVHEESGATYHVEIHDAQTGEILYGFYTGKDTGRGVAADVDPTYAGAEYWGAYGGMYSSTSTFEDVVKISSSGPSMNFSIFWDGDLLSELQNHSFNSSTYTSTGVNITDWDYETNKSTTLLQSSEILSNNGTKGTLGLVADVLGDWREEIICRTADESNSKIRIYTTTIETNYAVPTLMQDHEYRLGIAWQNVGYNQPANLSYLLSEGVSTATVEVAETLENEVTISWSGASDGVNGHEITGYSIYRSDDFGSTYELLETISAEDDSEKVFTYTDSGLYAESEYSYRVAAIVDGEESYLSKSVTANTTENTSGAYKFDFGINSSYKENGWTAVTMTSKEDYAYSAETGYGFTDLDSDELTSSISGRNDGYTCSTSDIPKQVYRDYILPYEKEFKVDLENGTYTVEVICGSSYNTSSYVTIENNSKVKISNSAGNYKVYTTKVTVTDGQMNFVFPNTTNRVNAITITPAS